MRSRLQGLDPQTKSYDRPNQKWICGNARMGNACRIGPDAKGRCGATFECTPRRDGDRWNCSRAPSAGGACEDGPLPDGTCCLAIPACVPVRSLRAKRGAVVLWSAVVTIGLLALLFGGAGTANILSPGPTTVQHSQVGECVACHLNFAKGPMRWIHAAFDPDDGLADSKQCLTCHVWTEHAFSPHSMDPGSLSKPTPADAEPAGPDTTPMNLRLASLLFGAPNQTAKALACGTCHKEHRGSGADLTLMSNGQCQSCHSLRFASLAEGHPQFDSYPYSRRTRIVFDHWSHIERHFEKAGAEKAPKTCTVCHAPSDDGRLMLVGDFSDTCAACHLDQIEGEGQSAAKGIAVLGVPGLDLVELRGQGAEIGEWPELSEEKITPFLKMLLAGDDQLRADLQRVESIDLLDLTDAAPEDLAAVAKVAWAVKTLVHDLLVIGMEPLGQRMAAAMGRAVDKQQLGRLVGSMPLDVVRSAQEAWFPNLFQEMALHRAGLPVPVPGASDQSEDEVLPDKSADQSQNETLPSDDEILSDDEEILSDDEEILSDDEEILSDDEEILADDEEILSDDEEILSDDDKAISESGQDPGDQNEDTATQDTGALAAARPEIDAEAWTRLGGWYLIDSALYFRPTGHADAFVRSWLDLSGMALNSSIGSPGKGIFESLTHSNAPGRCTKCHSVDSTADGAALVNWNPKRQEAGVRGSTVFSHTTHFSMLDEKGCNTCHKIDPSSTYSASFEHRDASDFASNFRSLEKAVCAQCHVESEAGDSCLDCHRYHLGRVPDVIVHTIMQSNKEPGASDVATGATTQ